MSNILNLDFQESAAEKIVIKFTDEKYGVWLNGKVGCGKSYITGLVIKKLSSIGFFANARGVFPVLWITKATAIEQTNRVILDEFGLDPKLCYVTNYDQFRANMGRLWVEEKSVVKFGEVHIDYVWNEAFAPKLFILDESQSLKNEDSQQSQIFIAAGKLPERYFLHVSASPFDRVAGAKAFVIHSKIPYSYGWNTNAPMCEEHWNDFAKWISGPRTSPNEYNKEACKRLVDYMKDYIVKVPKVKTKFKETNTVQCVDISPEKKMVYLQALVEYIEAVKRILDSEPPNGVMLMLVAFLMFRKKAEILKADELAGAAMASIKAGKAPIIGCNFKVTIAKISDILVTKYGLCREDISLIWGGISKPVKGKSTATAILDYQSVEKAVEDLDLGPQNRNERQKEIDRFQEGKSKVCLFTFKAGGVALSLHHHKEGQLPREGYFATTYSAIELLQALGRDHRVNSISDTLNTIILFKGTIEEEHVYPILLAKVQCIGEIVGSREKWADITLAGEDYLRQQAKSILGKEEEWDEEIEDGYVEEKEELTYDKPTKLLGYGEVDNESKDNDNKSLHSATASSDSGGEDMVSAENKEISPTILGKPTLEINLEGKKIKPIDVPPEQSLLPAIAARTFKCRTNAYLNLWYKLPNKRPCSERAVDNLCAKYGAEKPQEDSYMTYIEKPNKKRCLVRVDNKHNYTVAYED